MSKAITFIEEKIWAIESPLEILEGSSVTLSCTFWGTVTSPDAAVTRNRQTVTSTVMPSGSHTASGSVATLKPLTALVGGARYVITITGTVAGDTWKKKVEIKCGKAVDEQ